MQENKNLNWIGRRQFYTLWFLSYDFRRNLPSCCLCSTSVMTNLKLLIFLAFTFSASFSLLNHDIILKHKDEDTESLSLVSCSVADNHTVQSFENLVNVLKIIIKIFFLPCNVETHKFSRQWLCWRRRQQLRYIPQNNTKLVSTKRFID